MSTNRSSSTVRNLRAMFEGNDVNAERPSSTTSDRTSQGEGESRSRVSKIRASFVSVDRPGDLQSMNGENAPTIMEGSTNGTQPPQDIQSTLVENGDGQHDSKPVAGVEAEATGATELANANGPSTEAASTLEIEEPQESITQEVVKGEEKVESEAMTLPEKDTPAANPDKPTTAVEEEPGPLRPANPADVDTANAIPSSPNKNVSKKQSRTSLSRTAAQADSTAGTPATVSKDESPSKAKAVASKPSLNFRQSKLGDSPATKISSPKSPRRPTTSDSKSSETSHKPTTPSKTSSKPARSSLTAQTAASAARSKGASEATNGTSAASKGLPIRTKPKSPTKPVKLSSHLTAPTASSSARHEAAKPAPKPTVAIKSATTTRASLGEAKPLSHSTRANIVRSNSTATKPAPRTSKPIQADEGFLARMTRPTASSASRAQGHDKPEPKVAATKPPAARPRAGTDSKSKMPVRKSDKEKEKKPTVNGHVKRSNEAKEAAPVTNGEKESTPVPEGGDGEATVLDSSMAGIATPAGAEDILR